MLGKIRSVLTLKQKHQIKYCISIISLGHLQSFMSFTFTTRNSCEIAKEIFSKLHPYKFDYDLKRVGGECDGGYLIPNKVHIYDGLISPGVGSSTKFETEFVGNAYKAVLIDATVEKPKDLPENFIFLPRMLGGEKSVDGLFVTLQEIRNDYFPDSKSLALQMDIEGGEYPVFESSNYESFDGIDLILVEFHDLHLMVHRKKSSNPLLNSIRLLSEDFTLVHSHPNNAGGFFLNRFKVLPKVVETTWMRKELVRISQTPAKLPNELDHPNDHQIWDLKYPIF